MSSRIDRMSMRTCTCGRRTFKRYPLAAGFSPTQMQPARFTAADLFELTARLEMCRIVLIQMVFYGYDNSFMLDAIREYPEVFSGVAVV